MTPTKPLLRWSSALATLALLGGPAAAGDDKDKSGQLETWTLTHDDKVLGSESLRLVVKEDGKRFASGELKATLGKRKLHRKSHVQQGDDGHLDKYQRVEAGLKGAGVKLFEFEGKMRLAPVNAPGKPTPLGDLQVTRVWDVDLWHLYALWELPRACDGEKKLAYLDPEAKATATATLVCKGKQTVWDAAKKPVDVGVWQVRGVPNEVELWVDGRGALVGARGADRWMLRAKWAWTSDGAPVPGAGGEGGGGDDDDKVDPGIGE